MYGFNPTLPLPSLPPSFPAYIPSEKDQGAGEAEQVAAYCVVRGDVFALHEVMELVEGEEEKDEGQEEVGGHDPSEGFGGRGEGGVEPREHDHGEGEDSDGE